MPFLFRAAIFFCMQDICLKTKSNVFLLLPSWMWKLKCEKATTNLLNHYYWWISSDCDKKWSNNKILSVAHVARHDSWWASIFWAFVRVLSFGGFIIQLSRSLLSTGAGRRRASFRLSTITAAAAGEENVASNVASITPPPSEAIFYRHSLGVCQLGWLSEAGLRQ